MISGIEFDKLINKSISGNVAKSTRRILFNDIDDELMKQGQWHIDIMSGMGTVVIIKYDNRFFAITAMHVLKGLKDENGNYRNASPFWMPTCFGAIWETMQDFFMPKKLWNIGELIEGDERVIIDDICMIELYHPSFESFPNYYLDLDKNTDIFSTKEHFFEGRYLMVSGYPFYLNNFDWEVTHTDPKMTHSTNIHRQTTIGTFYKDDSLGHIKFENLADDVTHENSRGMSGGIIFDVQENIEDTHFCGLILNISNNLCTFLPSYIIKEAILNYKNASCEIIDPAELQVKKNLTKEQEGALNYLYKILSTNPKG